MEGAAGLEEGSVEDNPGYTRWLERMWDANRHAHYRRVEREKKRVEEVLGIFEELEEISGRPIEFPVFPASYKTPLR
jgi:hypothetical protein